MSFVQETSSLADLVRRYEVCWEVWPQYSLVNGQERRVGFEIELCGTHEAGDHIGRGCAACQRIYNALLSVAGWALAKEESSPLYAVGPYAQVLRYSLAHGNRPDIALKLKILQRRRADQPVDDCQGRCLDEMKEHLAELGADERHWRSPKPLGKTSICHTQLCEDALEKEIAV